ncbi:hypothetical protein OVY01_07645 [Robbsia sp. Bb-Pol-6]|uniref:Uncharacterized protein n=1 Tax=Robbsia betulipollinis TaxID=2981849 RepID=A0ABT3ZKQ6_9BURK|nr:hypothetical protein [Robbsia betulipollinis]MCY0387106.1 hypothetical protein [Robbsia betulipollinis]
MLTQTILEQLKARAYEKNATATGDALADLVNWIALHAPRLDGRDMSVMLSAALALYKIEIEKNWEVSAPDLSADPADAVPPHHPSPDQPPPQDAPDRAATDARHTAAAAAIASLVALRRPVTAHAPPDGASAPPAGRRWTDTGHWALTLR